MVMNAYVYYGMDSNTLYVNLETVHGEYRAIDWTDAIETIAKLQPETLHIHFLG